MKRPYETPTGAGSSAAAPDGAAAGTAYAAREVPICARTRMPKSGRKEKIMLGVDDVGLTSIAQTRKRIKKRIYQYLQLQITYAHQHF